MRSNYKNLIIDYLYQHGKLSSKDAVELFDLSTSTVRRLMIDLENEGIVIRMHGGVRLKGNTTKYLFSEKEQINVREKQAIAEYTVNNFVSPHDVLYLDSGTTVRQLAVSLRKCLTNGKLFGLTIITNSLANMEVLYDCCEVILIGGIFREARKDFAGFATERFLENFYYKKAFLGADGFDIKTGFSGDNPQTVAINEIVISRSDLRYILTDSSKFDNRAFIPYANSSDVSGLITDSKISSEMSRQINDNKIVHFIADLNE